MRAFQVKKLAHPSQIEVFVPHTQQTNEIVN
jgi:hypothetical protein